MGNQPRVCGNAHDLDGSFAQPGTWVSALFPNPYFAEEFAVQPESLPKVHLSNDETIRIGLVGCGNRGTGACRESLLTAGPVRLVAMADLFPERIETALKNLSKYEELQARMDVPVERRFVGFDALDRLLTTEVDLVLLATPPYFRPMHYAAAIRANKHVFMEKPCCIDAPGYRSLLQTNQQAQQKRLAVGVGLQRRHQPSYLEAIQKIHQGSWGKVQLIRTYFNMPGGGRAGWLKPQGMTELEYQIRHWGVFVWLCGDFLVEQATHQIDLANWIVGAPPLQAQGTGGRQVRIGPGNGDVWDHHFIEFDYAHGERAICQARQQPGTWTHVSETVHGDRGSLTLGTGPWGYGKLTPRDLRDPKRRPINPYQREHDDLMASIRGQAPYRCEGDYGATSSMTAVLGRMASYSGQMVSWEEAIRSEECLGPSQCSWQTPPPVLPNPDGIYPCAIPGIR